jgi:hypothetical protein
MTYVKVSGVWRYVYRAVYPGVLDELLPAAWHHVEQYANNPIEAITVTSSTG